MYGFLQFEYRGHNEMSRLPGYKPPFWVAEIPSFDAVYKYKREFVKPKVDYTEANSVGSRGVYYVYFLEGEKIYEVSDNRGRGNYTKPQRYFARVATTGEIEKVSEEYVKEWLNWKNGTSE